MFAKFKSILAVVILLIVAVGQVVHADVQTIHCQTELYNPYKYVKNSHLSGFDMELTNLIFDGKDYNLSHDSDSWEKVLGRLVNGEVDICGLVPVGKVPTDKMLVTNVVLRSYNGVFSRSDAKKIKMSDLKNYKIGLGKSQYTEDIVKGELGIQNYLAFMDIENALEALYRGEIDIVFGNQDVINFLIAKKEYKGAIVPQITNLYPVKMAYGVSKKRPELVQYINKKIGEIQDTGAYERLYLKYFSTYSDHYKSAEAQRMFTVAFIIVLTVLAVFVFLQIYIKMLKKKLSKEKDFSSSIVNNAGIIILVWKMDGTVIEFNKYAEIATGFSADEVIGKKWLDVIIPQESLADVKVAFGRIKKGELAQNYENQIMCRDGRRIDVLWNNNILVNTDGIQDIIVSMGVDISERKAAEKKLLESYEELGATNEELATTEKKLEEQFYQLQKSEEALRISEERYRLAVDGANDGLWDIDMSTGEMFISTRGREMLGLDENKEFTSGDWEVLIHDDDLLEYKWYMEDYLAGKTDYFRHEYRIKTADKDYKWILGRGKAIWDENRKPIRMSGSNTDITESKKAQEKIYYMAYYDILTDLPNRTLFVDKLNTVLEQAIKNSYKGAMMFMDLDNFKTINDTLGHVYGDQMLKSVVDKIKTCINEGDILARLGGDEFIILQPHIENTADVARLATKVLETFQQPLSLEGREFYITASVGVTVFPNDGEDVQTLLKNADTAMYRAKELGKNNYQLYNQSMNAKMLERLEMENSLRHAIERDELIIYYQPQINIKTGKLTGMEALVRWKHPTMGLVPPMKFIPIAEESGLIIPIGEWVLRTVCKQNKAWQEAGLPPLCAAVNLSARQFQQQNLVETVAKVLEETGLEPRYLELEITESIAMTDFDYAAAVLNRLKEMGVKVSLDDFGTGYSSLNYLSRLPISALKIDKSFVQNIADSSNEKAIAKAVIVLAHSMQLTVIAEGVETIEQLMFLKEQDCDMAQGYYYSKPVPVEEFEKQVKEI
ncbi:MAG: EAL domain-containing protein [Clostridia bacterium]|nr:EAL domain-containing protein [Clostridia bacterium]